MIFIAGYGQMCNNIIQFGHYYAWGKEHGLKSIGLRFCYKYNFFTINSLKGYNWFTYLFAKYGAKLGFIRKVSFDDEQSFNQKNLNLLINSGLIVAEGWYLRDYEAFLKHKKDIRELFSFKRSLMEKVDTALPLKSTSSLRLGIHARRGDYIRWKGGNYFFTDEEYLKIIHSFVKNNIGKNLQIIIVSNDNSIQKSKYLEAIDQEIYFTSGNAGEDLYALSTCDYIIGPPSTFSLMASFYRDAHLYWVFDKNKEISPESFQSFDFLFRHII